MLEEIIDYDVAMGDDLVWLICVEEVWWCDVIGAMHMLRDTKKICKMPFSFFIFLGLRTEQMLLKEWNERVAIDSLTCNQF